MPSTRTFTTAKASTGILGEIRQLLDLAFEGEFAEEDWEHALGGWHVVVLEDDAVIAHAAVVPRLLVAGERSLRAGYVEAVATDPSRFGEGLGSMAMTEATSLVRDEFELGALSTGRHHFYEQLGWERWQGPTFVREGSELIRTEEDDDGIMVLRFGPSQNLALTASLSCESRSGDSW
jgi:aminoglycoside 2'-N-acetyltransferase I